jgi:hypothetical protein
LEAGADLLVINRFGSESRDGKSLAYLIERADCLVLFPETHRSAQKVVE